MALSLVLAYGFLGRKQNSPRLLLGFFGFVFALFFPGTFSQLDLTKSQHSNLEISEFQSPKLWLNKSLLFVFWDIWLQTPCYCNMEQIPILLLLQWCWSHSDAESGTIPFHLPQSFHFPISLCQFVIFIGRIKRGETATQYSAAERPTYIYWWVHRLPLIFKTFCLYRHALSPGYVNLLQPKPENLSICRLTVPVHIKPRPFHVCIFPFSSPLVSSDFLSLYHLSINLSDKHWLHSDSERSWGDSG